MRLDERRTFRSLPRYQALAANTDAVVSLSSVCGTTGKFYELWNNPAIRLKLAFPWQADPRKMAEPDFAKRMIALIGNVAFAQEYAIDFNAAAENTIVLGTHIESCVDGDKRAGSSVREQSALRSILA